MCQGCQDFVEFERAVDQIIAAELPELLSTTLDAAVLHGKQH